jgi:hypothetical protein
VLNGVDTPCQIAANGSNFSWVKAAGLALIFWTEISGGYSWQLILSKSTGD